jgi:hypothetical protein
MIRGFSVGFMESRDSAWKAHFVVLTERLGDLDGSSGLFSRNVFQTCRFV